MLKTKLSLCTMLAAGLAVPALASADHARDARFDDRSYAAWTMIGEVGTHAHDAEDYVAVSTAQRLDQIELTAEGRPVRLDDVKFQMADGRIIERDVNLTLRDGQRIVLDVPEQGRVKMLVLEYANHGPFYRGSEKSRVEVRALALRDWKDSVRDRRQDVRYDDRFAPRPYVPVAAPAPIYQPSSYRPAPPRTVAPATVQLRAGVSFRGGF